MSVNDTLKVRQKLIGMNLRKIISSSESAVTREAKQCVIRMAVHACYFSSWEAEDDNQEFKTSEATQ